MSYAHNSPLNRHNDFIYINHGNGTTNFPRHDKSCDSSPNYPLLPPTFSASEMTYIVSSGALNSTHSLTPPTFQQRFPGLAPVSRKSGNRVATKSPVIFCHCQRHAEAAAAQASTTLTDTIPSHPSNRGVCHTEVS